MSVQPRIGLSRAIVMIGWRVEGSPVCDGWYSDCPGAGQRFPGLLGLADVLRQQPLQADQSRAAPAFDSAPAATPMLGRSRVTAASDAAPTGVSTRAYERAGRSARPRWRS